MIIKKPLCGTILLIMAAAYAKIVGLREGEMKTGLVRRKSSK